MKSSEALKENSKEVNATTVNKSLDLLEETIQKEVESYGDNGTISLAMSLMTYLATSMLVGFMRVSNETFETALENHITAIRQTYADILNNEAMAEKLKTQH